MSMSFIDQVKMLRIMNFKTNNEENIKEAEEKLPYITQEEYRKLDPWEQQEIVDNHMCPFCHGLIVCRPINELSYVVECEDCEQVFEEE